VSERRRVTREVRKNEVCFFVLELASFHFRVVQAGVFRSNPLTKLYVSVGSIEWTVHGQSVHTLESNRIE